MSCLSFPLKSSQYLSQVAHLIYPSFFLIPLIDWSISRATCWRKCGTVSFTNGHRLPSPVQSWTSHKKLYWTTRFSSFGYRQRVSDRLVLMGALPPNAVTTRTLSYNCWSLLNIGRGFVRLVWLWGPVFPTRNCLFFAFAYLPLSCCNYFIVVVVA